VGTVTSITSITSRGELVTPDEVADRFRVVRATVLRWAREGRLTAISTCGECSAIGFRHADVEALYERDDS